MKNNSAKTGNGGPKLGYEMKDVYKFIWYCYFKMEAGLMKNCFSK